MPRKFKRVMACADLHSGHRVGLTHPDFQTQIPGKDYYNFQVASWDWYSGMVRKLKSDIVFVVGDAVDGKGTRSGSTELITASWNKQREMAEAAIRETKASDIVMVFGTPYHTGNNSDHEKELAKNLGAPIRGQDWIDVNGTVFDLKHAIGTSSIPHGRHTAMAREKLWNGLWDAHGQQPLSDVIIRAHVHYKTVTGIPNEWLGFTLPALQGLGTKFGARRCSGIVNYGFMTFDCYPGGKFSWECHDLPVEYQKRIPRQL